MSSAGWPAWRAVRSWAAGAAAAVLVAAGAVVVPLWAGSGAAYATVPGKPGIPQPPTALYTEDFSHQDATSAGIPLPNYTGAPGTAYVPGVSGASATGPHRLVLVTCGGPLLRTADGNTYQDNILIYATPASA